MKDDQTATRRRSQLVLFACIVVGFVILDQVTKYLVRQNLVLGERVPVIPGIFDFELVYNKGAAFGMFQNATLYFVIIALVMIGGILWYLLRAKGHSTAEVVALGLIGAGAVGNCIDRVFMDGTVTDFIATAFMDFPVFNVADSAITIGCVLFVICVLLSLRGQKGTRETRPASTSGGDASSSSGNVSGGSDE